MLAFAITTVSILLWSSSFQAPVLSEKLAVASAQRVLASKLDSELPPRPFADWFRQLVGPEAGVNWQLNECGERPSLPLMQEKDLTACAEVNALLTDGRKVVVMIEVGTFKKGITDAPSFSHAAIEQQGELYRVRRLHDLPEGLREPVALARKNSIRLAPLSDQIHWLAPEVNSSIALNDAGAGNDLPPPPDGQKVQEGVLLGDVITRVQPLYPVSAKKVNASGKVEVRVSISVKGHVIEAEAVSGHKLLRQAAVDAARRWVFKPSILNGVPVQVQSILTFVFAPP